VKLKWGENELECDDGVVLLIGFMLVPAATIVLCAIVGRF